MICLCVCFYEIERVPYKSQYQNETIFKNKCTSSIIVTLSCISHSVKYQGKPVRVVRFYNLLNSIIIITVQSRANKNNSVYRLYC